ncbi:hypothetical protein A9G11_12815 [Gilliamella sp. wkB108]|nr:hypothetical protein A9G11_12815 [Gilliamella apicola]
MGLVKRLFIVGMVLALLGCDDKNKDTSASPPTENQSKVQTTNNSKRNDPQTPIKSTFSSTPELIEKYRNKQLSVLDSSEAIINGTSTLIVTFSVPLNPKLDFSNLLRLVDNETGNVDGFWELSDNGLELRHRFLEPKRKLTLTIDKMIEAINGSHLKSVYQTEITTQDRQPLVGFPSSGLLLPSKSMTGLPVITLNVDKVDVNFFKIKPDMLTDFIGFYGLINRLDSWRSEKLNEYADLVYSSRFDLNPKRNAQETVLIDLSKIPELQKEGVYVAIMNEAGTYNESNNASLFSISNIGISVHKYKDDRLTLITHALDDGKPLGDINLSLFYCQYNQFDHKKSCSTISEKSDAQGFAEMDLPSKADYSVITASDGHQTSFVNIDRNALNLSEFNLTGSTYHEKQLFAFGSRDLYRPGETITFNALLRDADGQLLPEQPIMIEVLAPDGQKIASGHERPDADLNGLYQWQYEIPTDAATGRWAFRFNLGDDNYQQVYFQVEEFLPERMAMEINVPSTNPILVGQDISFNVKGWYLYGAPASGNNLDGNLYMKKVDSVPGLSDFKIGRVTDIHLDQQLDPVEQKLDNKGIGEVKIASDNWSSIHSPFKIVLQASLLDSGGRPVTRYASQTIWPASQMPAIRALFSEQDYYNWSSDAYENRLIIDKGATAEFEIAYINLEGQKLATDNLKARIVRERRNYYWTWSSNNGWRQEYNEKDFTLSEEKLSIAKDGTAKVSYQPDNYGSYRIEVVDTRSNIISSVRFWSGYDWEDNTNGTNSVHPDQVKLSIDKTLYNPGDTAKVHVQAPVAGSGYISLETNDGMLWKKDITIDEDGLDVEIPIENWQRHDIYINAMIIRPSTDAAVQTIKRAIGLLYLPIDTSDRQLNLTIDVPKKTEPEKTIPVKVKLDKKLIEKNKKVTVLVSAVDSGVLNITKFATPDPYSAFLGRKRYNVDLFDVYGKLIEGSGRTVEMSFGGDAMESGRKPLNNVTIVAQQLETIQLNEEGEGVIDLTLPNFNGELRLMAQAWDDNRFGKAEQTMIVASPVIAELTVPRFLSGGDKAILALDLNNLTDRKQTLQLNVTTNGLLHQEMNKTSTTITVNSNQRQIIQLPVIADYGYGQGTVTVDVKGIVLEDGSNYPIKRSWDIGVRPAYNLTSKNYAVAINSGENWKFTPADLSDLIDNTVEGKLVVSNQPPLNIAQYIKSLFAYPYGCLEQTISGLYPSLYANHDQLTALGIKSDTDAIRHNKIQTGISRILSMQRNNGGFGLWSNESDEEYWLTVYATDFLLQARERGFQVNDSALRLAIDRIGQYVYNANAFTNLQSYYDNSETLGYTQFAIKAYAIMVLAKQNNITSAVRNEILHMAQQVENNEINIVSPLPVAQLALSAKLAGFQNIYSDLMPKAFDINYDKQEDWLGDYSSEIRDIALLISLLTENNLNTDRQDDYLFYLSSLLNDKRYFSTQELNALFIAGWSIEQHRSAQGFKVKINKQSFDSDKALSRSFGFSGLSNGLTVTNQNSADPLYIKLTVSGFGKKAPAPTSDSDFFTIKRSYYDLKGNQIKPTQLKVGDMMVVLLEVTAREATRDALIVDYLPAGLELENQNLANSSVNLQAIPELANLLKGEDSNDVKYQQYRDDRYVAAVEISDYVKQNKYRKRIVYLARAVTVGDFGIPYPYVESMYRPERFAIGKSLDLISIVERNSANK